MNTARRAHTIATAAAINPATPYLIINGRRVTVADALNRLDAGGEFIRRFGSWAGRHAADAYRDLTGKSPARYWINKNGTWRHVFGYNPLLLGVVYTGFRNYKRTAVLLAVTGTPLALIP